VHQPSLLDVIRHRVIAVELAEQIRSAIERNQLLAHYQPKVDLFSGQIVGAEALVRWRHPTMGLLPPSRFLPQAEHCGLIGSLGAWMRTAVARFAAHTNRTRQRPLGFAVNASVLELTQPDFLASTARTLALHQCDPGWLTIEVTESVQGGGDLRLLNTLRGLRAMGLGVALDDFGTGYSCLSRLLDWPLTEIKIDRSFVRDLGTGIARQAVVRHTICIADQLGLSVVAEGIETQGHRAILAQMGCREGQGFLFGRPQDAAAFGAVLSQGGRLAPALRPASPPQTAGSIPVDQPGLSHRITVERRE
jgi:EAL domain-containing protein (putative c-di-GMP-specific phosphodiesterase class I)